MDLRRNLAGEGCHLFHLLKRRLLSFFGYRSQYACDDFLSADFLQHRFLLLF